MYKNEEITEDKDSKVTGKISAKEFREEGYLLEVNRRFFHPLGLAMYVNEETEEMGVFDSRKDPEGWRFGEFDGEDFKRSQNIMAIEAKRFSPRDLALGYWTQPMKVGK